MPQGTWAASFIEIGAPGDAAPPRTPGGIRGAVSSVESGIAADVSLVPDLPTIARARAGSDDLLDRLWRLLSSVRFALLLIGLIAGAVFVGTIIMQAPAGGLTSPDSYDT